MGTALLTLCLWIGAPASASAIGTSCTGIDASCLTQGVRDDVGKVTRNGGDAVNDIGRRVDDTVEGTIDAVERVAGTVESPGIPAPGGGPGHGDGPGAGTHGGDAPHRGDEHVGGPSGRSRSHVSSATRAVAVPILASRVRSGAIATEKTGDSSVAGTDGSIGVGRMAAEMGRRLALPLTVVIVLVILFVAMQSRLDRGDPRLHLASLDEKVSRFR